MSAGKAGRARDWTVERRGSSPVKAIFQGQVEDESARKSNDQPQSGPVPSVQKEKQQGDNRGQHQSAGTQKRNHEHGASQCRRRMLVNRQAHAEIEVLGAIVLYAIRKPSEEKDRQHGKSETGNNDCLFEERRLCDKLRGGWRIG